jgi:hypothetical protein
MSGQRGMTIAEMAMAIATTGIIVAFLGTAIYQIFTVSGYGNDRLTATHELENAAYWFNIDGQGAKAAAGGETLAFTMSDESSISYALTGTELHRNAGGAEMILAQHITSAHFTTEARTVTMSLTASPPGRYKVSVNGTYQVYLRPTEAE